MIEGTTGVYAITCLVNGYRYVGSSANVRDRWYRHRYRLRCGTHHIKSLQLDWNEYGEDAFEFQVVLTCERDRLFDAEQVAIDEARGAGLCYNPSPTSVSAKGYKLTPDQRAALSEALKGRTVSEETRRKIGASNRARWAEREITPELRERLAAQGRKNKGSKRSAEARANMSAAQKGKPKSAEHRANISAAMAGRKLSDEQKAAIGRGALGHPCYTAKLTADKVREIKRRLAAGEQGGHLASEFHVSPMAISDIKRGRSWANVTY